MNNLHNIASLHRPGAPNAPAAPSGGQNRQDLSGFLDQVVQALNVTPDTNAPQRTQTISSVTARDLKEKIAALLKKPDDIPAAAPDKPALAPHTQEVLAGKIADLLQKNNLLPETLKQLSPEELAAKIAALLESNNLLTEIPTIKPALTSDLVARLSDQIQDSDTSKGDFARKLADMLNNVEPGSGTAKDMEQILAVLQDTTTSDTPPLPIDPAILQQLRDQVSALLQTGGDISNDAIAKLKADIIQALTDKGINPPGIQHYLSALIKDLKEDLAKADIAQPQALDKTAPMPLPDDAAPHAVISLPKAQTQAKPAAPAAPKLLVPSDDVRDIRLTETPKQNSTPRINTETSALKDQAAAQAAPAELPAQAPIQNLSAKIAGASINPGMINALAGGDGSFNMNGFGADTNGRPQQDLINSFGMLKPVSADGINSQNFTNYLAAARSTPHAVTQMLNLQLQRNIASKIDTMTLQLEPADLGKLDIKLKFDREGGVRAHMSVEKPETLALLQRDSHHLERVLQQSGLDVDEKSLSFDLRQGGRQHNLEGFNGGHKGNAEEFATHMGGSMPDKTLQAQMAIHVPGYINASGVNIMV